MENINTLGNDSPNVSKETSETNAVNEKNFYVSTTGDDSNPGSFEKPFRTVQKGCDVLKPGDTLNIMGGTYNEKITINTSGTKDAIITIRTYNNEKVILDGTGRKNSPCIIYIQNKSYLRIQGLEICNASTGNTPTGIMVEGYGSGIEIIGNKVYKISSRKNAFGIAFYGTNGEKPIDGVIIKENEVFNCKLGSSESLVVNGNVRNFQIIGNKVHDNNNIGICCIGFERTAPKNDQARNGIVSNNTVYNIDSTKNPAYDGEGCADGIYVDGGKDILIENNLVYNCNIGIEVASEHLNKSSTNVIVRSNLIYGSSLHGLSFGGASSRNGYAKNCEFVCNTLYNNSIGICIQKSQNNNVASNIIYDKDILLEGKLGSNTLINNLWYSPIETAKSLTPFADPKFVDPEDGDFHLRSDSPGIDNGDPYYEADAGETDLDGNPRVVNGKVDCGTYEFQDNI